MVLIGAGLFVRSAIYLQAVKLGYDGSNVLTARVSLPEAGYDTARVESRFQDLVYAALTAPWCRSRPP